MSDIQEDSFNVVSECIVGIWYEIQFTDSETETENVTHWTSTS